MAITYVRIDLDALRHNIETIRAGLRPGVKLISVVKANGYGHGMEGIAQAAVTAGADWLAVAIPEEGIRLREAGVKAPILTLGGLLPASAAGPVTYDLSQTVFTPVMLRSLQQEAARQGKTCNVHIKVDTGMHRIGVTGQGEFRALLALARECENIRVEGLFTHFAESEAADQSFTRSQARRFEEYVKIAREMGFDPLLHAANSGATHALPEFHYDMVRCGIAQYGYASGPGCGDGRGLIPVMSWRTAIVHLKEIAPGDTVSYGRRYRAETPRKIATIPVGYGDGYRRAFTGRGSVLIRGKRAPLVGAVCMDQCMVDVTDVPDVEVGDEAVLLGTQNGESILAEEMADWADTVHYEILCGVADRVLRIYEGS